ncbi:MAG: RNA-binding protein [Sphingobacteriales bacterium]|nr:MAG: RNA-binding protein [Sphingobacteriales bacterium]
MNIYIGNLHTNASEAQIKDLFTKYGAVNVRVAMDDGGHSKGYALVSIADEENGMRAVKALNQQNFMNRYLEVAKAPQRSSQSNKNTGKG